MKTTRLERFFWRLGTRFERMVLGERWAAKLRFAFAFSLSLFLMWLGYYWFEHVDTWALAESWYAAGHPILDRFLPILLQLPLLDLLFKAIAWVYYFVIHFFRHALIPVAIIFGAFFAAANYVQDIYELAEIKTAIRYLLAALFGIRYPRLRIADGEMQLKPGEEHPLAVIGGPGYVNIRPGNAVLFESLRSPSSVASSDRLHFITRFDTIREIVSLDDQHGFIEEMKAVTKDGIEVIVRDVHFRYRLRTGREYGDYAERTQSRPYPFSVQGVKDMTYNRSVRTTGLSTWHQMILLAVDTGITDFIKAHTLDHLTSPNNQQGNPRDLITKNLMGSGIRNRIRRVGADLLWFDIGHFGIADTPLPLDPKEATPEKLSELIRAQRVHAWGAKWEGHAAIIRSHGEAQRLSNLELGRAEGQADMLRSIIKAMEEAGLTADPQDPQKNLRAVIMTRTAQILESLAEQSVRPPSRDNLLPPQG